MSESLRRSARSQSRTPAVSQQNVTTTADSDRREIAVLSSLTRQSTRLKADVFDLLLLKRRKLRRDDSQVQQFIEARRTLTDAALATFVFAQEEAGTAVCISPSGVLLTCSHCVADTARGASKKRMWLISAAGVVVQARCIAWDGTRDLALMQIITAEPCPAVESGAWPCIEVDATSPKVNTRLFCIGHPGSEDFETDVPGTATGYDVLHVSEGRYRGCEAGQDVQDNSEIGALKHDCWTYWGHSGAPLIHRETGKLVGLHSSWDDTTGMRRGVALPAVVAFIEEHLDEQGKPAETLVDGLSISSAIVVD